MAVLMVHEAPGASEELYEKVVARLTDGRGFHTPSDWGVDGLLSHAAGPTDDGWRVIDVWESAEAFERFGAVIVPVLEEIGFPGEPKLYPLHNFVK
jgi:hypothetical protein